MPQLASLDQIVLATIDKYLHTPNLPSINLSQFELPLVVGSGNGYITGKILFRNTPAFFASESEVEEKLERIPSISEVVVVSASGEKHAPIILNAAKAKDKKTYLISSSRESTGKNIADTTWVFPKITEPYTYNTSTYFGYLYGAELSLNLEKLRDFILGDFDQAISRIDWGKYASFCVVLPNQFVLYREMIETKFIELFGRKVARDVFSYEQMRHATTVVQDERELFICFGNETGIQYGENQVNLPIFSEFRGKQEHQGEEILSKGVYERVHDWETNSSNEEVRSFSGISDSYAAMMLTGYYLVGKIQNAFPPYFFESIEDYCQRAKVQSGFNIQPLVEV